MRLLDSNHLVLDVAKDDVWFDFAIELDNKSLWSGTLYITLLKLGVVLEWKIR